VGGVTVKVEFKLPDVGEGMHEGEIVRFLVNEGDLVKLDQPIIEVQTDKVTVELPSPAAGTIVRFPVAVGVTVPVGEVVVVIETEAMVSSSADSSSLSINGLAHSQSAGENRPIRILATPHTRRIARELGVNIEQVKGTGPVGRVTEEDVRLFATRGTEEFDIEVAVVEKVADSPVDVVHDVTSSPAAVSLSPAHTKAPERIPMRGLRKKIADKMVQSKYTAPHVTSFDDLDVTALVALRNQIKPIAEQKGIKLTYLPFFIKALVIGLKDFPVFNASLDDAAGEIVLKKQYNIGVATDTEEGLIVPVIHNADQKSIFQLAKEVRELADRARSRKLTARDVTGGTFTISNVGPIGGLFATPIINYPEVAIFATHKIEKKPVVRSDEIVIREMMNFSLSFDHRVADGVTAVRFTNRVKELLEQPQLLFMELV
jgi:2-oxoisovalerate dehydrogenase E2 component (dihydrolipoyl transacylase)